MADVTIFVLHPNEQYCQEIIAAFQEYDPELELLAIADLREAPNRVREEKPAAVVVGVDTPNDPALKSIDTISNMPGDVGIVVVSKEPTQRLLVSCMRAGSDEFLEFPIDRDELAKAMGGLFRRKGIASQRQGKVVAVFSASGGTGVTTIACNLGAGIAASLGTPKAACIVDMNLQFGSVALVMDLREFTHTLADAAHEHERLDENLLNSFLSNHASGCAVLPSPLSLQELEGVDPWDLRGVVQTCRKSFNYTVLDMPHSVDDCTLVGLDEADEVLLVCDMVLPAIRNTIQAVEVFHELDYKADKLKLVVNRFYDSDQISLDELVEHVGLPLHWLVPYDSRVVITSLNSGQMLEASDAESPATHSLMALAQNTAGITPSSAPKKRRGLFSWVR
jgi:pilus assembly protein CpaE